MKYKVRINPVAIADVQEIKAYVAEDNPQAAVAVGNTLYSKIGELTDFPQMGAPLTSKIGVRTDYRFLVCGNYLVLYKIEGEFVSIYRVRNRMRDYLSILFADELPKA